MMLAGKSDRGKYTLQNFIDCWQIGNARVLHTRERGSIPLRSTMHGSFSGKDETLRTSRRGFDSLTVLHFTDLSSNRQGSGLRNQQSRCKSVQVLQFGE